MRSHQDQLSHALAQSYSSLRSAAEGDQQKLDLLDEVESEIVNSLTLLMLFPETDLVEQLIAGLEDAAQHDDGQAPGEQVLLDRLRGVRFSMDQLDLATVEAWQHIGRALQSLDDQQQFPNVARFQRRGNDTGRS